MRKIEQLFSSHTPLSFLDFWCRYNDITVVNVEFRHQFREFNEVAAVIRKEVEDTGINVSELANFYEDSSIRKYIEGVRPINLAILDASILKNVRESNSDIIVVAAGGDHIDNVARALYNSGKWTNYNKYSPLIGNRIFPKKHESEGTTIEIPLSDLELYALKNIKDVVLEKIPVLRRHID